MPVEACARSTDDGFVSDSAGPRPLRLRRPDHCAVCGTALPAGTTATWHAARRVVTCLGCVLDAAPADPAVAGASARRIHERRHIAREDRARQKFGPLGVFLARVIDEPQSTRAWKTGADGEERAGARFAKLLAGSEVKLLHDRRMPGRGAANVDHVAIGPGGITVIDTKNYRGKVRTDGTSSQQAVGTRAAPEGLPWQRNPCWVTDLAYLPARSGRRRLQARDRRAPSAWATLPTVVSLCPAQRAVARATT